MGKGNSKRLWVWSLIGVLAYLYYYTFEQRVLAGFFESTVWTFWNELVQIVLGGLIIGFVVTELIKKIR